MQNYYLNAVIPPSEEVNRLWKYLMGNVISNGKMLYPIDSYSLQLHNNTHTSKNTLPVDFVIYDTEELY